MIIQMLLPEATTIQPRYPTESAELHTIVIDARERIITFGDYGFGEKHYMMHGEQFLHFMNTAQMVYSSPIPMKLEIFMGVEDEFSIRSQDRTMKIAGIECDVQYALGSWLENLKHHLH